MDKHFVFRKAVGDRINKARYEKHLTQSELGKRIGNTLNTVSNIEKGVSNTYIDTYLKIAEVLEIDPLSLFTDSLDKNNKNSDYDLLNDRDKSIIDATIKKMLETY